MSTEFSSDEEYLPSKYPCSVKSRNIIHNWNLCKEDLQDPGRSNANNSIINSDVKIIDENFCDTYMSTLLQKLQWFENSPFKNTSYYKSYAF
jgi:hypothetical protein